MSRLLAWAVHAFTMSGLVFATLAVLSMVNNEIGWMWVWLAIALVIDGIDGTFARGARVKEVIPWFDGSVVDIVIDYLTWTFIPALFMYRSVPMGPKPVASALLVVILVSAMFCYANEGEKSNDNYFVGFPAAWNIVAVMVWVLQTPAWLNIAATILMTILTLVPTHYVHPVRVKRFRALNVTAVGVWIAATAWLLVVHPVRPQVATVLSVGSGLWLVGVGVLRSVQGEAPQSPQSSQSSEASAKP
ncbi:CDP-alcohol phosphatidyltransferase family protein [Actinomyces massiliensis]|uniref:CDP-alcohol phosphatidyltransferase family protein n=1 Tax=Actinomyces massiliensis TaxID=461393 RepID=UPI0036F30FEF